MNGQRELMITADGSATITIPESNVTYHSRYGALQESLHVFIEAGLHHLLQLTHDNPVRIFEMGLGTGLNAWLTVVEAQKYNRQVEYTALELFPLQDQEWSRLVYTKERWDLLRQIHTLPWERPVQLTKNFILHKIIQDLLLFTTDQKFHLIYYDAFAPAAQPELWTATIFSKLFRMLCAGGVLVTYCAKGDVRRAMLAAGFSVEKLPGPKGKREMLRAVKK
jgi:tRNA U34 5-methylaminomethyl-2-thiouridine-forming methyltransferase MnmC